VTGASSIIATSWVATTAMMSVGRDSSYSAPAATPPNNAPAPCTPAKIP
jgi:hypothetical protein